MAAENKDARGLRVEPRKAEAEAVAEIAARFAPGSVQADSPFEGDHSAQVFVIPEGMRLESTAPFLAEMREHPRRREGMAVLRDAASLADYVNMFKSPDSRIYAAAPAYERKADKAVYTAGVLTAVIDHHRAGFEGQPDWQRHRAQLPLPLAPELTRWLDMADQLMEQAEFAEWLEHRGDDVLPPLTEDDLAKYHGTAQLVRELGVSLVGRESLRLLARGLRVTANRRVETRYDPTTGETTAIFEEEHAGEGQERVKVPNAFLVKLPLFQHGEWYLLLVRLRHRPTRGGIMWGFSFHNLSAAIDDAFGALVAKVRLDTGLPVWLGTPG